MAYVYCQNEHGVYYRGSRGAKSPAGQPCPTCGETLRGRAAFNCNKRVWYVMRLDDGDYERAHRAKCTEPKGHEGACANYRRAAITEAAALAINAADDAKIAIIQAAYRAAPDDLPFL